jgi:hypothetical protein
MQTLIFYMLMIASAVGWFAFVFLFLWYWTREQRERTRIRQTKADIADIMMLFQTMRDVVVQQKQLAAEFNQELERKVGGVKQILSSAVEKNERLYERQRDLERELRDARSEIDSLQRQLAFLPPAINGTASTRTPAKGGPAPVNMPRMSPSTAREATQLDTAEEPPFMALPGEEAEPVAAPAPAAVPEATAGPTLWEQVDLAALTDNTVLVAEMEDDELDEEETLVPADGDAAREAFRALLDLSGRPAQEGAAKGGATGAPRVNPALQKRIVEYAQAGMAVSDIARELGVGKGEVRLMLSLAKPGQP